MGPVGAAGTPMTVCMHPQPAVPDPPPPCKKPPQVRGPALRAAGFASRGSLPLSGVSVPPAVQRGWAGTWGTARGGRRGCGAAADRSCQQMCPTASGKSSWVCPQGEHAPGAGGERGVGLGSDRGCGAFIKCARPTPCPPLPLHADTPGETGMGSPRRTAGGSGVGGPHPSAGTGRVQGAPAPHVTAPRGCLAPLCSGQ